MAIEIKIEVDEYAEKYVRNVAEISRQWEEGLITTQECYDKTNNEICHLLNVSLIIAVKGKE